MLIPSINPNISFANMPPENATTTDRIIWYVENERYDEAKALAKLGDTLEEAFEWEVSFSPN